MKLAFASISLAASILVGTSNAQRQPSGKRLRVLSDEPADLNMSLQSKIEHVIDEPANVPASSPSGGSSKSAKAPTKAPTKAPITCTIEDIAGSFKLDYDFYNGAVGDYVLPPLVGQVQPRSYGTLTFTKPDGDGSGVMKGNWCFNNNNKNQMVVVQTGFVKDGILPLKIAKYEDDADIDAIYNESSFLGEYDCNTKTLMVGFTGHFDANAFTANPAEKMPSELADLLNDEGCVRIFF